MNEITVSICIITYNHEKYIKKCLDSALNQVLNCNYEIVIGEDNSTDNTLTICKYYAEKHPNLIKLYPREENLGMAKNWLYTINDCVGKYILLCEGDDYWIDPYKSHKQYTFLENNKEYSICWTNFNVKNGIEETKNEWEDVINFTHDKKVTLDNFGLPYCTYTLTTCFRKEILKDLKNQNFKYFKDNTLYVVALNRGGGMLLNFKSSVYRKHQTSIYSSTSEYSQSLQNYLNLVEILLKFKSCRNTHFINYYYHTKNRLKSSVIKFSYNNLKLLVLFVRSNLFLFFKDPSFYVKLINHV